MRISISGSHSTGKTMLAEALYSAVHDKYPKEVILIKEVARIVIAKGFLLNRDATIYSYINYILEQLNAERKTNKKHVISDRSLVDLLAYILTNNDPKIPNYFVLTLEEIIWLEKCFFDLYCYLPIEFPLIVDDVRPSDQEYQIKVDKTLINIFDKFNIDYVTITGSLEERCKKILNLIK